MEYYSAWKRREFLTLATTWMNSEDITDAQKPSVSEMLPLLLSLLWAALTQTPDIHVQGTLESGLPRNITCAVPWACERGTPHTFSWTGVALPSLHPKGPHSSVLTLTLGPQDHGTNLTCRVTFPGAGVSADRTIRLNVSYAPQNLDIRVFRGNRTGSVSHPIVPGTQDPGQRHLPSSRGGPVPAPGLCCRQQPTHQDKLGPWVPDSEPLTAFGSWGPGAAPRGLRGWRRINLPSSAPEGLPPCLPEPSCTGCLLFLLPSLWGAERGLLAPGPHVAQGGPDGGWFPSHLWPHLDLLYQVQKLTRE
ncbi:sialic acid-binding Ig-like lectin 10 isoform X3 [Globicephala melas]|uniref:sialic acid-binding Ig-like lectin 10 isoform X3 n=1 Tax=Globicephala melas TaxID=9731 RepID=UPI00293D27AC|nr:sialic acid-binding Ig-like lectin 10 isoform X3 [Globicephala melas]